MEDYSEEEQSIWIGETTPDEEPRLPVQNLYLVVSRIRDGQGDYLTKIWFSRQVRRYYAMGLLHEVMSMLEELGSEVVWSDDTPGFINLDDLGNEDDGLGNAPILR